MEEISLGQLGQLGQQFQITLYMTETCENHCPSCPNCPKTGVIRTNPYTQSPSFPMELKKQQKMKN